MDINRTWILRPIKLLMGIICILSFEVVTSAGVENLDEMMARKDRHTSASWGAEYLEAGESGHYIWQPETLCYNDVTTGREVWRMTNTPSRENWVRNISMHQWSADGKRLAFASNRGTNAYATGVSTNRIWMVVNSDGTILRPTVGGPSGIESRQHDYFFWSTQIPDVYYQFGRDWPFSLDDKDLYRATVSDTGISKTLKLSMTNVNNARWKIIGRISPDGRYLVAKPAGEDYICPIHIAEDGDIDIFGHKIAEGGSARFLITESPNYYTTIRNYDYYWGEEGPDSWANYHDCELAGVNNDMWFYHMLENANGLWWRMKLIGSAEDGGPSHTQDRIPNYEWGGELEPVNTTHYSVDHWTIDPWLDPGGGISPPDGTEPSGYMSHVTWDRWGRYAVYSHAGNPTSTLAGASAGTGIYDCKNNVKVINSFEEGTSQHHSWNAWSDWSVSSRGHDGSDYLKDRIYMQTWKNLNSSTVLCYTHTRYNENGARNGDYEALTRPSQSADGTKVLWHSTYLNSIPKSAVRDDRTDIYFVVAYYPYPPEIAGAVRSDSKVRILFDFRQNTNNPRTYTARGWPDENNDSPPLPKEIRGFRLWTSSKGSQWIPLPEKSRLGADRSRTDWFYDVNQELGTTRYYGVTSIEHSGIESHRLSNIWKVTLDGTGKITEKTEGSLYPADPGGESHFYKSAPLSPKNVVYVHKKAPPVNKDGQYTIEWDEPEDTIMIRYYNIYAEDGSVPTVDQSNRIASIARGWCQDGKCKWVDVFGNPNGTTKYKLTSVDYQGNESTVAGGMPSVPENLRIE